MKLRIGLVLCGILAFLAACDLEWPSSAETVPTLPTNASERGATPGEQTNASPCFAAECHADLKQKEQRYKHRPYVDERCLECHKQFHTVITEELRLQIELDECYSCHSRVSLGITHPVGPGVNDPIAGRIMTCTSTCHRSHTAPYRYLLALPGEGALCVTCHTEFLK